MRQLKFKLLPRPPYSPDVAALDYHRFGPNKEDLPLMMKLRMWCVQKGSKGLWGNETLRICHRFLYKQRLTNSRSILTLPRTHSATNLHYFEGLHMFAVGLIRKIVFWVLAPCRTTIWYRRFGENCCCHLKVASMLTFALVSTETTGTVCKWIVGKGLASGRK